MDQQHKKDSDSQVLLAINQFASSHERIAESLDKLEKLWAEEMKRRDLEYHERKEWMKNSEEKAEQRMKDMKIPSPAIPWQITWVWVLAISVLTLGLLLILIEIFKHVFGSA